MPERLGRPQLRNVTAMEHDMRGLWLLEDDVPWLLRYLADEVDCGGVPPLENPDGSEDDVPEESAVAEKATSASAGSQEVLTPVKGTQAGPTRDNIRWDFQGSWVHTWRSGPKRGTTTSCRVAGMTAEKWAVAAAEHEYTTTFADASEKDMRDAARHYLQIHVRRLKEEARAPWAPHRAIQYTRC